MQRQVPLAPLDLANEGPVKAHDIAQVFLTPPKLLTPGAYTVPEELRGLRYWLSRHGDQLDTSHASVTRDYISQLFTAHDSVSWKSTSCLRLGSARLLVLAQRR